MYHIARIFHLIFLSSTLGEDESQLYPTISHPKLLFAYELHRGSALPLFRWSVVLLFKLQRASLSLLVT